MEDLPVAGDLARLRARVRRALPVDLARARCGGNSSARSSVDPNFHIST
jgi:hypothetical protein